MAQRFPRAVDLANETVNLYVPDLQLCNDPIVNHSIKMTFHSTAGCIVKQFSLFKVYLLASISLSRYTINTFYRVL